MKTLASLLRNRPTVAPFVNGSHVRCKVPAEYMLIVGGIVAISISDARYLFETLAGLDGLVRRLVLIPASISTELLVELCDEAEVSLLITDRKIETDVDRLAYVQIDELLEIKCAADRDIETEWVLCTSGTTSRPKLVSHSLSALASTAKPYSPDRISDVWGLLYDPLRFAGLQVCLNALCSGAQLIAPQSGQSLQARIRQLTEAGCTHLSATPTIWRTILMTPNADELSLKQITLGGEIADQSLLDRLKATFPSARITHIYASTEAGVGFSVQDGKAGFPLDFLDTGPLGCELMIVDNILYLKSNRQTKRLWNQDSDQYRDGFINSGDVVQIDGARVYFRGRESGTINVGGAKVHPEYVEQIINSVPGVVTSRVFGKPSPITGELVAAEVQIEGGDFESVAANIRSRVRDRLSPIERPVQLVSSEELFRLETGKTRRS